MNRSASSGWPRSINPCAKSSIAFDRSSAGWIASCPLSAMPDRSPSGRSSGSSGAAMLGSSTASIFRSQNAATSVFPQPSCQDWSPPEALWSSPLSASSRYRRNPSSTSLTVPSPALPRLMSTWASPILRVRTRFSAPLASSFSATSCSNRRLSPSLSRRSRSRDVSESKASAGALVRRLAEHLFRLLELPASDQLARTIHRLRRFRLPQPELRVFSLAPLVVPFVQLVLNVLLNVLRSLCPASSRSRPKPSSASARVPSPTSNRLMSTWASLRFTKSTGSSESAPPLFSVTSSANNRLRPSLSRRPSSWFASPYKALEEPWSAAWRSKRSACSLCPRPMRSFARSYRTSAGSFRTDSSVSDAHSARPAAARRSQGSDLRSRLAPGGSMPPGSRLVR